jgi:Mg/Co/Ni transporter MgtE
MMNLLKNTKVIGGLVVAIGLLAVGYYYWGGSSGTSSITVAPETSPASQDLLLMLSSLHSIKLDPTIFSDPLFTSLSDFGVTIPPQPAGRPNPFAPAAPSSAPSGQ